MKDRSEYLHRILLLLNQGKDSVVRFSVVSLGERVFLYYLGYCLEFKRNGVSFPVVKGGNACLEPVVLAKLKTELLYYLGIEEARTGKDLYVCYGGDSDILIRCN